jgi:hypothetical protein
MTRDEIIRMAREAGFVDYELEDYTESGFDVRYERFASLVAAAEREAILQMSEEKWFPSQFDYDDAIRTRGQH